MAILIPLKKKEINRQTDKQNCKLYNSKIVIREAFNKKMVKIGNSSQQGGGGLLQSQPTNRFLKILRIVSDCGDIVFLESSLLGDRHLFVPTFRLPKK